jgi:NodT family efflux transporter outer membrane factor (OMF) lipoprotein
MGEVMPSDLRKTSMRTAGRNWRVVLLLGLAAVAHGALAQSKAPKLNVDVPQQWTSIDRAFSNDSIEEMSQWWEKLGDATLSKLIERSLKAGLDLRSAEAKLRESLARRGLASANRRPSLTASGSTERDSNSSGGNSGSHYVGSDATWDLDFSGAKRSASRAAEADYRTSEADLHNTQVSLAAEVAQNYVQLRAYQTRLEIARRNDATQSETLQIAQWREQAGLVGSVDVEQARANRDQTRAQIPTLETNISETQHTLELLAGATPGQLTGELAGTGSIPSPPDEIAIGIPADALRQRPDVRAAEGRVLAETARVAKERAARYPSFKLTGSLGLQALTGALTGGTSALSSLASSFSQTLFDGGRTRQNIEIQSAVQQQAVVKYESTVLTALKEVENALVSFSRSRERLASLTTAVEAARNAATLAQNRYTAGLVDFQTVLDTERTALNLEDSVASTQADRTAAVIQLYQALGGGWSQNSAQQQRMLKP